MSSSGGVHRFFNAERIGILLGVVVGVAACAQVELGAHAVKNSGATEDDAAAARPAPVQVAADAQGYALWSGFRTTNGPWIAHPMLPAPSKAYVRNTLNGRVIEATLLRRDPATPGPMILLSAEAARDLDIGPHRLTKVEIEVIGDTAPDVEVAAAPTAAADVSEAPLKPVEAAVPEAAETPGVAGASDPAPATESAPGPRTLAEIPAEPAPATAIPEPVDASPAPQAAAASEPVSPAAPEVSSSGVFRGDAPYELQGVAGGGGLPIAVTTDSPAAAAPVSAPIAIAAATASAEPVEPPARPVAISSDVIPGQSYVQVVSFTSEGSASQLATRLDALGHPSLTDSTRGGSSVWHRVLIGPLDSARAAERALEAARELGYSDAFVTANPPAPAATAPKAQPVVQPTPATPKAEPKRAAPTPAEKATAPVSGDARAYIQVGSFSVAENATAVAAKLKGQGLPAFTDGGPGTGSKWHRVRIGPLNGSEATQQALQAARSLGHGDAYITRF